MLAAVAAVIDHLGNARRRADHAADERATPCASPSAASSRLGGATLPARGRGRRSASRSTSRSLDAGGGRGADAWRSSRRGGRASRCGAARSAARRSSVQVAPDPQRLTSSPGAASRAKACVYTEREAALAALMPAKAAADTSKLLLCPMPGLVKAIHVAVGQEVKAGDALAVVEAMKMENMLRAERDGVVKAVNAKPGDSLAVDAVIMEFA